ncbi:MAG: lasso peptide biosynthesis B2 protein [Sphingopyxis sp.]|uniref:lasso peptide biosynthesis B2 protein n=1 Tax=Sphingopyxis sp. TaxID=1908224 RepID=UPI003D80C0C7
MAGARPALRPRIAHALRWRWRVAETIAALVAARFLVRFVPFGGWRRTLGPMSGGAAPIPLSEPDRQLVRAVARDVARWAPRLPLRLVCLPRAMAARWVLARRGIAGRIVIGARRGTAENPVDLHAWLMVGDICVTGDAERRSFEAFARRGGSAA